jgi:hypothetical protein
MKEVRKVCIDSTCTYAGRSGRNLERGTLMADFMICKVRQI